MSKNPIENINSTQSINVFSLAMAASDKMKAAISTKGATTTKIKSRIEYIQHKITPVKKVITNSTNAQVLQREAAFLFFIKSLVIYFN